MRTKEKVEREGGEKGTGSEIERDRREIRKRERLGTLPKAPLFLFRRPRDAQRDHR